MLESIKIFKDRNRRVGAFEKQKLARQGEKLALKHLKKQGYRYITSNFATAQGEIDLIMQQDEAIVFVEVKTRREESFATGQEAVNYHKQKHIEAVARQFIHQHNLYDSPCRFDVVVIVANETNKWVIRHFENAFGGR